MFFIEQAFQALMIVSPSFFDSSTALRRKDIALLPFKFALCAEPAHHEMYSTAAAMFKQALLDPDLSEFYGGRRLHWIPKLQASAVVVNLVQQAHDDEDERVLRYDRQSFTTLHCYRTVVEWVVVVGLLSY